MSAHGNGPEGGDVWPSLAYRRANPLPVRRAWTPPTVRRFSAGCAETDLVVVGSSVVAIEDAAAERERQAKAAL